MSSISSTGPRSPVEVSGVAPTTMASPPPAPHLQGTLAGTASMLSMSTNDLRGALESGRSISDVASQQGVSRDSVVRYIGAKVQQQRAAQGKAPIDPDALDRVVQRAVDRRRGAARAQPSAPPPPRPAASAAGGIDLLA